MNSIPKVVPSRFAIRLARCDKHTPSWRSDVGREFRVGYYSRKDRLDCNWLVSEDGEYEADNRSGFLLKYFDLDRLSQETNFYGRGKRRFAKLWQRAVFERLNGKAPIDVYEAAKEIWQKDASDTLRLVIQVLHHGKGRIGIATR